MTTNLITNNSADPYNYPFPQRKDLMSLSTISNKIKLTSKSLEIKRKNCFFYLLNFNLLDNLDTGKSRINFNDPR
jgi:hypothetical protein